MYLDHSAETVTELEINGTEIRVEKRKRGKNKRTDIISKKTNSKKYANGVSAKKEPKTKVQSKARNAKPVAKKRTNKSETKKKSRTALEISVPKVSKAKKNKQEIGDVNTKGICRIDQDSRNTYGWYLRVRRGGLIYAKFFSDKKFQGKTKAFECCKAFRDELEHELGLPRTERYVVTCSPQNKTGMIGVQRKVKRHRLSNGEYSAWNVYEITYNPVPGKTKKTSVSIDRHGEKEAFLKACLIRLEKELEIYGCHLQKIPKEIAHLI